MKIDRLIGIITTLQQKKIVKAPYLAEKFEVSRRTINRDIEDIETVLFPYGFHGERKSIYDEVIRRLKDE